MKKFDETGERQCRNVDKLLVSLMNDLKELNNAERAAIIASVLERLIAGTMPAIGRLTMSGVLSAMIFKIHTSGSEAVARGEI